MSPTTPRNWPWWLWIEHGIILGYAGWKSFQALRALKCRATAPPPRPQLQPQPECSSALTEDVSNNNSHTLGSSPLALERLPQAVLTSLDRIKALAGSPEVLTWPDVNPAPAATMEVEGLANGQAASHHDSRGSIYKFKLAEGVYVNMYYTKAGYRRSGDLHDCNQYDVVLQGRTRLRMIDPHSGREVVREYGPNDFIVIPARTPHMFEFLEDNCLLEWWDDTFRAWYYTPYRRIIEQGLPLEATEGTTFHLHSGPGTK